MSGGSSGEIPNWKGLSPDQREAVNKAWAGAPTEQAYQATPKEELLRQLMDCRIPKNEREHFAARHIADLQRELADANAREARLRELLLKTRTQLMAPGHAEVCISCALSVVDDALASAPSGPDAKKE